VLSTPIISMNTLTWPVALEDGRLHVRRWLINGGDIDQPGDDGMPTWAAAMHAGHPESVEELIEAGADLTLRDNQGSGWLHWGIASGQSLDLLMNGFRLLDHTWWHPNHAGDTPLHLPYLDISLAQAMGTRLWSERVSWAQMAQGRDPQQLAKEREEHAVADVWATWRARGVP
jgi:hypothetical protein